MSIQDFSPQELGKRVAEARGNLTQKDLADMIGVSRSYVGNIEQGITMPSLEVLIKICRQFHISLDWLVFGTTLLKQKSEPEPDSDLQEMMDVLKKLMDNKDSDLHSWAKVQFKKAFDEYYPILQDKTKK